LERNFPIARREPTRVQMWAIAHPVRLHIWHLLVEGPSTASRLGRRLGESRSLISYHLRVLAGAGAIVEAPELGDRRDRWWRRPELYVLARPDDDLEGRAIDARTVGLFFARDEAARRRLVTGDVSAAWRAGGFVGNWFVELTPEEADALAERIFALVQELRVRPASMPGAERALVSLTVLPF
jgi:DNA-binding transcriptional ArsR family regulator